MISKKVISISKFFLLLLLILSLFFVFCYAAYHPCEMKDDYPYTCSDEVVTVQTQEELDSYMRGFGFDGSQYKNLHIDFDFKNGYHEIRSPCKITFEKDVNIDVDNICIDGREGINLEQIILKARRAAIQSSIGKIIIKDDSKINADDIVIKGNTITVESKLECLVCTENYYPNKISIIGIGTASGSGININEGSSLQGDQIIINSNSNITINENTNIDANKLYIQTNRDKANINLKNSAHIESSNIKNAIIDISSHDQILLGKYSMLYSQGNINLNAKTKKDCLIHQFALVYGRNKYGNCF